MKNQKIEEILKKVSIQILLCAGFGCFLGGQPAQAAEGDQFREGHLMYTVLSEEGSAGTVYVSSNPDDPASGALTIPDSVLHEGITYSVSDIAANGFYGLALNQVTLPSQLTRIGSLAFAQCLDLKEILVPETVTWLGKGAFFYCLGLEKAYFEGDAPTVEESDTELFLGADVLIYYREGTQGWSNPWQGKPTEVWCSAGKEILMGGVEYTYEEGTGLAFVSGYTAELAGSVQLLPSITVEGVHYSVNRIDSMAFKDCMAMEWITIPEGISRIGNQSFCGCTGLRNVEIPDSVKEVGERAFYGCSGLTGCVIGHGTESLKGGSFMKCENLISAIVGESVNSLGVSCFGDCSVLNGVYFYGNAPALESPDTTFQNTQAKLYYRAEASGWPGEGNLFAGRITALWTAETPAPILGYFDEGNFKYSYSLASGALEAYTGTEAQVNVPETFSTGWKQYTVTEVKDKVFANHAEVIEATLPRTLTKVGTGVFSGCTGLKTAQILGAVTQMGEDLFARCSKLESVQLAEGITSIGVRMFATCTALSRLEIPDSVTEIGTGAFMACMGLKEVVFGKGVSAIPAGLLVPCRKIESLFFKGDAPSVGGAGVNCPGIVYYVEGTQGWTNPWNGHETATWTPEPEPQTPLIQITAIKTEGGKKVGLTIEFTGNLESSSDTIHWERVLTESPFVVELQAGNLYFRAAQ